jgi:hypothetical protein
VHLGELLPGERISGRGALPLSYDSDLAAIDPDTQAGLQQVH